MKRLIAYSLNCFILLLSGCTIPLLSEMQSARTVEKGNYEITPQLQLSNDQIQGGIQFKTGINLKTDIQFRAELGQTNNQIFTSSRNIQSSYYPRYGIITIGMKHAVIRNYLAFDAPVSIYISSDYNAIGIGPSIIGTLPIIKNKIELSLAPKLSLAYADSYEILAMITSIHSNLAISHDLNKWAFRLEFSLMQGNKLYGGTGISYTFSKSKKIE